VPELTRVPHSASVMSSTLRTDTPARDRSERGVVQPLLITVGDHVCKPALKFDQDFGLTGVED
jgi:hypothetical protein